MRRLRLQAGWLGRVVVPLALTMAAELPPASRAALVAEVEAIWGRAGVQLAWEGSVPSLSRRSAAGAQADPLRVLVMMRPAAGEADATWPVAELVRAEGDDYIAIASIDGAQRVLASSGFKDDTAFMRDHRLGVVLGRAVAHEIGHYLLRTAGHARSGLMRTRVDARDFADLRDGGFYLDKASALLFQPAARTALR